MKRTSLICAASLAAVMLAGITVRADDDDGRRGDGARRVERERIKKGFEIAPVPLDLSHKNPSQVGLGSYLVNAIGGCNDCHTNPSYAKGGDPFMGQKKQVNAKYYLGGGQMFGPFVSRNLTPENGLPAGRTYAQFREILRKGTDFDNPGQLLQVMPWPTYQSLNDHDIEAIYEYLRAIPPATPGP